MRRHLLAAGISVATLALVLAGACGDGGGDGAGGAEGASGGDTKSAPATAAPSKRVGHHPVRRLLTEAPRSELSKDGLFMHLGGLDGTKYTRGGWGTGWGTLDVESGGVSFTPVDSKTARLMFFDHDASGKGITVRARSTLPDQKVTLYLGAKAIATNAVTSEWSSLTFAVPEWPTEPALRTITLGFAKSGKPTAEVEWVWLHSTDAPPGDPPLAKSANVTLGDKELKALVADGPRRHSYYMEVPADAELMFDYGAEAAVRFQVAVGSDGEADEVLFDETAEAGKWKEGTASLARFAGKVVRIDLITDGPAGAAGWGDPAVMRPGPKPEGPPPLSPATHARNVIFIVMDTMRADLFEPFNPAAYAHTPEFNEIANAGTVFLNAYDNENWTKPSTLSMLTGVYPSTHNTKTDGAVAPDELVFIGEALQKAGVKTGCFIANGFVSDAFGFKQGWDDYKNYIRDALPSSADHVFGDATEWLKENKEERFFLYLQTIDPHVPYRNREEYVKLYHPEGYSGKLGSDVDGYELADVNKGTLKMDAADKKWSRALYDSNASYHDEYLGKFFDELATMGLMEDTLIILTNDHGEEHHDHGRVGHGGTLYEEMIRAPLVVHYPKLFPAGGRVEEVVESVDILPTVLDVMGVPRHEGLEGRSLLAALAPTPEMAPFYSFTEFLDGQRAVRVGPVKLVDKRSPSPTMYDLVNDPGEKTDAKDSLPVATRMASIHLAEALATRPKWLRLTGGVSNRVLESGKVAIEGSLKDQLEALGYLN